MDERSLLFTCQRCGFCCHGETTVSLDESDQQRMLDHLGLRGEVVGQRYWRVTGQTVQMRIVEHRCIFYHDGCSVYPGRPWRCAEWPLVRAILIDEANFTAISDSCPGINKDLSYPEFCAILKRVLDAKDADQGPPG